MVKQRIEWVDILKGIAIIWLMIYHLYVFEWLRSPVGVFFFLSGLFYRDDISFSVFLKKKATSLLIPFLFFFVLGIVASFVGSYVSSVDFHLPEIWKMFGIIHLGEGSANPLGVGAIWFLVSLFEIYVVLYCIRLISKHYLWSILFSVAYFIVSSLLLENYAMGSLCYLIYSGYFFIYFVFAFLAKSTILNKDIPIWGLLICVIGYLCHFIQVGGGILLNARDFVSSMSLLVLLVGLCKKVINIRVFSRSRLFSFLSFEGRNSLTILGIHMLVQSFVILLLQKFLPPCGLNYIILFCLELAICNGCILLFNRYVPFLVNHRTSIK